MASTAPPALWQSDILRNSGLSDVNLMSTDSRRRMPHISNDQVAEAYRHVRQVVTADSRRDSDLFDLLSSARREETYQPYIMGWPSLLRSLSPTLFDLPSMVQDKYRSCQTMCFCGVFPQIKRAWASIDNSLFLWRYDKSNDVPVEYCGEDQAICAVGLVCPRPGVFLEAVHHVIVLATTVEIVMLGVVSPSRRPGTTGLTGMLPPISASANAHEEVSLQPLPGYSVPSDNVITSCVTGSAGGRIFLGGSDGHVYELLYNPSESWRKKRCTKVRVTGGIQQYLPSFIPAILGFGAPSAIDRVVVDDERHILYSLSQSSAIQVFDLGAKGNEPAKKVADVTDFYAAASAAIKNGREVFRNSAGERKSAALKYIVPIAMSESQKLHLLAVTADGRRVYFSTQNLRMSTYYGGYNSYNRPGASGQAGSATAGGLDRPVTLLAVFARAALPHAGGSLSIGRMTSDITRSTVMEVVAAHYSSSTLLLSESAGGSGRSTKLLVAARSSALTPSSSVNVGTVNSSGTHGGLRESLTELDNFIPGETCALEAVPIQTTLGPETISKGSHADELSSQVFSPPPRFVLISTAGVLELEKRRPVDILQQMLEERSADKQRQFTEAFGAVETAAMCFMLACSRPGVTSAMAVRGAISSLENPLLVGEARLPEDVVAPAVADVGGSSVGRGGIYMGQAVNPNPEPDWSSGHRGLCLYVARLLHPVWDQNMVRPAGKESKLLTCHLSSQSLRIVADKLLCLESFLQEYLMRRKQRFMGGGGSDRVLGGGLGQSNLMPGTGLFGLDGDGIAQQIAKRQRLSKAAEMEDERTARVRSLVCKSYEALVLLQLLSSNNIGRLTARMDDASRAKLLQMTLRDLVCDNEGEAMATKLISMLVTDQLDLAAGTGVRGANAGVDEVASSLQQSCPSFFKEDDRTFYQASAKLKQAEGLSTPAERDSLVKEAVTQLMQVPLSCNMDFLVSQLAYLRHYEGIVDVSLAGAAAADPNNLAMRPDMGADCDKARQRREAFYIHVTYTLRTLISPPAANGAVPAATTAAGQKGLSKTERDTFKASLLKAAVRSKDVYFHFVLYGALVDAGMPDELLALHAPHLEQYLLQESGLAASMPAMANAAAAAATVGPLMPRQLQLAELLSKLHIQKGRFNEACAVHCTLAVRRSGPGDMAVTLEQRVLCFQGAVLQAKSVGDAAVIEKTENDLKLMTFQRDIHDRIIAHSKSPKLLMEASELARLASELQQGPLRDVSELYNDFAQPLKVWDMCLLLVNFSGSVVEPSLIAQLWDHHLIQVWDACADSRPSERLVHVAEAVEQLGCRLYSDEATFPLPHVTFRLEQVSAGLWPVSVPASSTETTETDAVVVRALHGACKGSFSAVRRVYDLLLARRAPGVPESELSSVRIKTHLLRSLLQHCRIAQHELSSALVLPGLASSNTSDGPAAPMGGNRGAFGGDSMYFVSAVSSAQREAGNLAEACDRFAMEARRLGTSECEALAVQLDGVKRLVVEQLGSL